jgi:hypothetical protein
MIRHWECVKDLWSIPCVEVKLDSRMRTRIGLIDARARLEQIRDGLRLFARLHGIVLALSPFASCSSRSICIC